MPPDDPPEGSPQRGDGEATGEPTPPPEERGAPREVRSPADVADELGVSSSGLRRLALIYERVHGDLPRDPRLGRMWPAEAIDRLAVAREEVQAGRAVSIEAALAATRAGVEASPPVQRTPAPVDPSEALLEELRLLRKAVEGMSRRMEALERENRELREAVGPGTREAGELAGEETPVPAPPDPTPPTASSAQADTPARPPLRLWRRVTRFLRRRS